MQLSFNMNEATAVYTARYTKTRKQIAQAIFNVQLGLCICLYSQFNFAVPRHFILSQ